MEINYVVTIFPGPAVADPGPEALFREEYFTWRAAVRRDRIRIRAGSPTNFGRVDAERDINAAQALARGS